MASTFLSAKQNGFTGQYSDWITSGRPDGASSVRPDGSSSQNQIAMTSFPKLEYTDRNGVKRTFDPNAVIQQSFMRNAGGQRGMVAQTPDQVSFWLSNLDHVLDPNFSKNLRPVTVGGSDLNFRSLDDVDWSKFTNPEEAKKVLNSFAQSTQAIAQSLRGISGQDIQNMGTSATARGEALINLYNQTVQKQGLTTFSESYNKQEPTPPSGGSAGASAGPSDVGSLLEQYKAQYPNLAGNTTALFAKAQQDDPNLKFSQFTTGIATNPATPIAPANANPSAGSAPLSGDRGTISEQNKTGMPYPTWAAQQKTAGQPSSYNDWLAAQSGPATAPTTPAGTTAPTSPTTPASATGNTTSAALAKIDQAVANGLLDNDTAMLFRTVVNNWDVNTELNIDNVLKKFDEISSNTISPYFAEQAQIFKKDVQSELGNLQKTRALTLENQNMNARQDIKNVGENLEARGMTFSSEAADALGNKSAFGDKVAFGGKMGEGTVNAANRMIASGSEQAYKSAIDALGRQTEDALGAEGASMVPGFTPRGVTQGTIAANEQAANAGVLQNLSGQNTDLNTYRQPLQFNFGT